MILLAVIVQLPNMPALVQLVGGAGLIVLGAVIWKGRKRANRP